MLVPYYTVSQKRPILACCNVERFWYFLAEMLPIKYAIKRRFAQVTCASALPDKMGKHENCIFPLKVRISASVGA